MEKWGSLGFEPRFFGGYMLGMASKLIFTGKLGLESPAQHQLNISNNRLKMLSDRLKRGLILFLETVLNPFGFRDGQPH